MKTPSHAIINLAILGRTQHSELNLLIVTGGILPDIPIFLFYFWAKYIARLPELQFGQKHIMSLLCKILWLCFIQFPLRVLVG
jgi:hypothetical protein